MRKIVVGLISIGLLIGSSPAFAQGTPKSKTAINSEISSQFPNNTGGLITPLNLRNVTQDMTASFQQYAAVNAQTGTSYTIAASDYGQLITLNNSAAVAVSLPAASSAGFYPFSFYVSNLGSGTVTITPVSGTINSASSLALIAGQSAYVISDGANWQIVQGGGSGSGGVSSFNTRTGAVVPAIGDYSFSLISGVLSISQLPTIASNTLLGNATSSAAGPSALALPSCSGSNNALQWTTNSGFGCATISGGGGGGGTPGGTSGQIQWNSSGSFAGFTMAGDATLNTSTGALTLATVNGNAGTFGSSTAIPTVTVNAKGLITAASTNAVIAPAGTLTGSTLASGVTTASITTLTGVISSYDGAGPTNGQLLIGETSTGFVAATLTAGSGISITNGAGAITIANSGVTSVGGLTGAISCGSGVICSAGTISASGGGGGIVNGYLYGCAISNDNTNPTYEIDVSACYAADSTNAIMMSLSSATINLTTTGANGLDTGSIAANDWYAVFVIYNGSTTAAIATQETAGSFPSPTMPSGYTYQRYVGSFRTNGSAQPLAFSQTGNQFFFNTTINADLSVNAPATAKTLLPLTVPLGFAVFPIGQVEVNAHASRHTTTFWSPAAVNSPGLILDTQNTTELYEPITTLPTDSSGRLEYQDSTGAATLIWQTLGWTDPQIGGGGGSGGGSGGGGNGTVVASAAGLCAYYPGPGAIATVSGETDCKLANGTMTLGIAGSVLGSLALSGNGSQTATLAAQSTAGNATSYLPTVGGTLVASATSLFAINSTTGQLSLAGQVPLTGGGTNASLTAVAGGVFYSTASAGAISAAGTANQLLCSGGTNAPAWCNVASALTAGTGITLSGATNVTVALSTPVSLANGGTGASLTASTGGIPYSTGAALAMLGGTSTAGLCLVSGSSAAPSWGSCGVPPGCNAKLNFNATGNGTTDDTAAIQNALNACGFIYLPEGTYKVTGSGGSCPNTSGASLVLPSQNGIGIIGDGPYATIIEAFCSGGSVGSVISYPDETGIRFENFLVTRSGLATNSGAAGISGASDATSAYINNVYSYFSYYGFHLGGMGYGVISNSSAGWNDNAGFYFDGTSGNAIQWQTSNLVSQFNGGCGFSAVGTSPNGVSVGQWNGWSTFANVSGGACLEYLDAIRMADGFLGADGFAYGTPTGAPFGSVPSCLSSTCSSNGGHEFYIIAGTNVGYPHILTNMEVELSGGAGYEIAAGTQDMKCVNCSAINNQLSGMVWDINANLSLIGGSMSYNGLAAAAGNNSGLTLINGSASVLGVKITNNNGSNTNTSGLSNLVYLGNNDAGSRSLSATNLYAPSGANY